MVSVTGADHSTLEDSLTAGGGPDEELHPRTHSRTARDDTKEVMWAGSAAPEGGQGPGWPLVVRDMSDRQPATAAATVVLSKRAAKASGGWVDSWGICSEICSKPELQEGVSSCISIRSKYWRVFEPQLSCHVPRSDGPRAAARCGPCSTPVGRVGRVRLGEVIGVSSEVALATLQSPMS
jgi:hypothetical protein